MLAFRGHATGWQSLFQRFAVVNGKIMTVGGFVGAGVHRDGQPLVFEYDPAADSWRTRAPLKAPRASVGDYRAIAAEGAVIAKQ